MPDTPITPIIGEITEMQAAFKQPSCNSKQPMVEYPSTGTPPVISFNVPQNTAFTTFGYFMKYFPPGYFLPFTKKIPENNYYNTIRNMNATQVVEILKPVRIEHQAGTRVGGVSVLTPMEEAKPTPTSGPAYTDFQMKVSADTLDPRGPVMWVKDTVDVKANYAANGLRSYDTTRLNGFGKVTNYVAEPPQPTPRIIVLEEYTTTAYLGNYGAGKVVKTFSLYPGERTTISVRTYKDIVSLASQSKNVLDSFSESSATALDELMQMEQGNLEATSSTNAGSSNSFTTNTDSRNSTRSTGIKGGLNLGFLTIGGGYGKSMTEASTSTGGMSSTHNYNQTASRVSNMNTLASSLNKHVQQSNAARQIDVNTTTSSSVSQGEETVTVRELQNVNLNNTLNITYRQLLQEYTVITHLSNVRFAYTNGYPESFTVVDLSDLPNMLLDILDTVTNPGVIEDVLCELLSPYCNVLNYQSATKKFVDKLPLASSDCLGFGCTPPINEYLLRKDPLCEDEYTDGVVDIKVNGVILKVQKQTLQTSSLIADALLGRGDALDCFNQNAQNAENINAYVNAMQSMQRLTDNIQTTANDQLFADQNLELGTKQIELKEKEIAIKDQQLDVVTGITDPLEKATHYKKVFGDCCDVPQSCCGGGCGCSCSDTTEEPPTP